MNTPEEKLTPLMRQYFAIKQQYQDTLLLFQVGDFYELFFDDAKQAAAFLGIALTKRGKIQGEPIPLCGVPVHALDFYLVKLIKGGFKIALCDQLEPAVPGKVVDRGVTQVLTPGTLTDSRLLDDKTASYLCSFVPSPEGWALLFGELMTGQLFATQFPTDSYKSVESELARFFPDEIVLPHTPHAKQCQSNFKQLGYFTTLNHYDDQDDQLTRVVDGWVENQLGVASNEYQVSPASMKQAIKSFYSYVQRNQRSALEHFNTIQFYKPEDFLLLDHATQRNLELVKNTQDGGRKNTLFAHLDKAVTGMGSRMLKKWLQRPLINLESIQQRQEVVKKIATEAVIKEQVAQMLREIGDLERVVGRIALGRAPLSDYVMLSRALQVIPPLKDLLGTAKNLVLIAVIVDHIAEFYPLHSLLAAALHDDPARDWIIKQGFDLRLDQLRELCLHSDQKILELEQKEQAVTGNASLKIRYNQVQGYYIELTKLGAKSVPDYYVRQQTLVGKERFMIPTLRALQDEIVEAKNNVSVVEKEIFDRIKADVLTHIGQLRRLAYALSNVDALVALGTCAYEYGYVCPVFNNERAIVIEEGRHPVIEMQGHHRFIPNSTNLTDNASLWIITGPNMGGKSTYLRQVALLAIMAQIGSFLPAKSACLPLLDRIFTRIGAGDNLAEGKSTFLVEMEETAMICTQATERSLVILDEVGRGTSTFDGLAIAQAVVEYIYTTVKARCLFATHYHELTALQDRYSGIKSYFAASKKTPTGIVFLYKIMCGVADGSFGLEVAKLAQLPRPVLGRAADILQAITQQQAAQVKPGQQQTLLFPAQAIDTSKLADLIRQKDTEIEQLRSKLGILSSINYNELSPKQAFDLLWQLKDV